MRRKFLVHWRCHMSRYILVLMGASYLGKSTRLKLTVQNAKPQDSWRWMLATVSLRGSSRFLWKSYVTFRSFRGSKDSIWPRKPRNRWHGTKKVFDTTQIRWCIPPTVSHGLILMRFIVRKLNKLGVGMLCIKYRHTANCLSQTMKITTMIESSFKKRGYKRVSR